MNSRSRPLILLAALLSLAAFAPPALAEEKDYIVVLKGEVDDPAAVARQHGSKHGATVKSVWGSALKGYAATIDDGKLADLRADTRVAYVEADGEMRASAQVLPWGINRVDADLSPTARAGNGSGAVTNVNAYVIDSGIASHSDLDRVGHVNFRGDGRNTDCNGHGTHVAGTIAARDDSTHVVGVAPGAPLTGVKVLGCDGSGATSGVINGVHWVTANARKPAVANMSLGGSPSQALDDAVRNSARTIFYALAAGNEGTDACTKSPSRAGPTGGIATTGATESANQDPSFGNYGACVDIWASGVSILSTSFDGATSTLSGTSMASPHMAGGGALHLSRNPGATPAAVEGALKTVARGTGTAANDGRAIRLEYVGGL